MLTKFIIRKGKIGTLFAILISINQRKYEKEVGVLLAGELVFWQY